MATEGAEGYVQVATDGAGKKIHNVAVDRIQPDGTTATVYEQVVRIVAADGREIDLTGNETHVLLRALLREMSALRVMYANATGQFFVPDRGSLDGPTT